MSPEVPWSLCLMNVCCQLLGKSMSQSLSFGSCAAWLKVMRWMRSTTKSDSLFHCAPGMGQLQCITGRTFCWGSSFFFLPSLRPCLGEPGSDQQPWCSREGPHSLIVYSSVSAQGGDVASRLEPFIPATGSVHAAGVPGRDLLSFTASL